MMFRVTLIPLVWMLVAFNAATLHAATAYYSPSDGVVSFAELEGVSSLSLESVSGALIPPVLPPPAGIEFVTVVNAEHELQWALDEVSNQAFLAGMIVQPNTLLSDLTLNYTIADSPLTRGFIVIVPEPTSAALLCLPGAIACLAFRRRR